MSDIFVALRDVHRLTLQVVGRRAGVPDGFEMREETSEDAVRREAAQVQQWSLRSVLPIEVGRDLVNPPDAPAFRYTSNSTPASTLDIEQADQRREQNWYGFLAGWLAVLSFPEASMLGPRL